jgi:non-canonical purine NTP pyrophosphatase (RdgB/HAM1 family)
MALIRPGSILVVATTNPGKIREIRALLAGGALDVRSLDAFAPIEAPEETGATFAENARLKAEYYARATGELAVADDSGLAIDALDGRPGVHSARYPGASYPERFANLFRELAAASQTERTARFVCAVALASPSHVLFETEGTVEGEIVEPRGSGGFGYDPIFFHPPSGATLAEIPADVKARISHRGAAFGQLRAFLERTLPSDARRASIAVRAVTDADRDAVWGILEPTLRVGETYALPRDMSRDEALAWWYRPDNDTFVAEDAGEVVGSYFLRANQLGGGAHVANCGYVTASAAQGRGIARAMVEHSLAHAKRRGFVAMQFNFVVRTNERAVRIWQACGFEIVGTLPEAFAHPRLGLVDAYVMYKRL